MIYVTRDTHKKIVLGARGQTIKAIGAEARAEMMEMFGTPVHLFLFIKVRANWADDPERYREMGLDWTKRAGKSAMEWSAEGSSSASGNTGNQPHP